jgi:hypothetical protein
MSRLGGLPIVAVTVLATTTAACATSAVKRAASPSFTVKEVQADFARHNLPLARPHSATFGGERATALQRVVFTGSGDNRVIHSQDFVVFVFARSAEAVAAMKTSLAQGYIHDSRGATSVRANVVVVWDFNASKGEITEIRGAVRSL